MFKKLTVLMVLGCFLSLQACGTLFKQNQIGKSHSSKLDWRIVVLDAVGLVLFVIPGIMAFTVDYLNGTLYLPSGRSAKLEDVSPENIQKILKENNVNVTIDEIKSAQKLALNK